MAEDLGNRSIRLKFAVWIFWVAANAIGTLMGIGVLFVLVLFFALADGGSSWPGQSNVEIAWELIAVSFQALLPFGALIGLMQWLVIRKYVANSGSWFLTSAVAMFLSSSISGVLPLFFHQYSYLYVNPMQWFLFGGLSGLLQWLFLRKQFDYSGLWILANIVAGSITSIFFIDDRGLIGGCLGWMFSGTITGGAILFLLQHRKTSAAGVA